MAQSLSSCKVATMSRQSCSRYACFQGVQAKQTLPVAILFFGIVCISNFLTTTFVYKYLQSKENHSFLRSLSFDQVKNPTILSKESQADVCDTYETNHLPCLGDDAQSREMMALETRLRYQLGIVDIKSCRWNDESKLLIHNTWKCPLAQSYVYMNDLDQERVFCGQYVGPKSHVRRTTPCNEAPSLTSQNSFPPSAIRFNSGGRPVKRECDVPCYLYGRPPVVSKVEIENTPIRFYQTMEAASNHLLASQRTNLKEFVFEATSSFKSAVPVPYYSAAEYNIQNPQVEFNIAIPGASFLAKNCGPSNDRTEIVKDLIKEGFRVDSLSSCFHNAEPPPGVNLSNKTQVMQSYMFYLAFENTLEEGKLQQRDGL